MYERYGYVVHVNKKIRYTRYYILTHLLKLAKEKYETLCHLDSFITHNIKHYIAGICHLGRSCSNSFSHGK